MRLSFRVRLKILFSLVSSCIFRNLQLISVHQSIYQATASSLIYVCLINVMY